MAVADQRALSGGGLGIVRNVRLVSLNDADFIDERGFVFQVYASPGWDDYLTVRPVDAGADVLLAVVPGQAVAVAGIPVLCAAVRQATGVTLLVGNL